MGLLCSQYLLLFDHPCPCTLITTPPRKGDLEAVRAAFELIDRHDSGAIGKSDLAAVLKAMGTRATAEELQDMVCV